MIWISSGNTIFVLYGDGSNPAWEFFPDRYIEGEQLKTDLTIPTGFFIPQRGFGKLWLGNTDVRDRLGWGVLPEQGYQAQLQSDSVTNTRYITGADGQVYALWDGQTVWQIVE